MFAILHLLMEHACAREHVCFEIHLRLIDGCVALLNFNEQVVESLREVRRLCVIYIFCAQGEAALLHHGIHGVRKLHEGLGHDRLEPAGNSSRCKCREAEHEECDGGVAQQVRVERSEAGFHDERADGFIAAENRLVVPHSDETEFGFLSRLGFELCWQVGAVFLRARKNPAIREEDCGTCDVGL